MAAISRLRNLGWMEEQMYRVPFVEWDRYTVGEWGDEQHVAVYGWIDREDDHEDFVLFDFWPESEHLRFVTSSAEYTEEIHRRLFPEDDLDGHDDCRRVERTFDLENVVELEENTNLGEFA